MFFADSIARAAFRCVVVGWACVLSGIAQAQGPVQLTPSRVSQAPVTGFYYGSGDILGTPHDEILSALGSIVTIVDTAAAGPASLTSVDVGAYVAGITVGDLDQDGRNDIVCQTAASQLKVVKNHGGGTFTVSSLPTVFWHPVHLADFTGDGFLDILCGGQRWTNDGAGAFPTSSVFLTGASVSTIDVIPGDFDGDGDQDMMRVYGGTIAAGTGIIARIFRQNSNGTFTQLSGTLLAPDSTCFVRVADFDQDGRDDLLLSTPTVTYAASTSATRYQAFLGQVGTVIVPQPPVSVEFSPSYPPVIADWNDDGFPDLAVRATTYRGTLSLTSEHGFGVLVNDGTGQFGLATGPGLHDVSILNAPETILTAFAIDDDFDGSLDLAVVQPSQTAYFRNASATASAPALLVTDPAAGKIVARSVFASIFFDVTLSVANTNPPVPAAGHFVIVQCVHPNGTPFQVTGLTSSTGQVLFNLQSGYSTTSIPITISTPEGPIGNFTLLTQAALTVTGGSGQTVPFGTPFAPLTGQLVDASSAPIEGVTVYASATFGNSTAVAIGSGVTDTNGHVSINAAANTAGTATCRLIVPQMIMSPTFMLTSSVAGFSLTITQGAAQVACGGAPIVPIVGRILTNLGVPLAGLNVTIAPNSGTGPLPVTFDDVTTQTDANGIFTFTGVGNPVATTRGYSVTVPATGMTTSFNLSSQAVPYLAVLSGQVPAIDLGAPPASPVVISVTDCSGVPFVGVTVNLLPQTSGVAVPAATMITDGMGEISFFPTFSDIGSQRIRATVGTSFVDITTLVRGLSAETLANVLVIEFRHDHSGVPLLLAVDAPPTSPYLATPYGDIWTTILAPQPTLAYLDGFGLFGSIDPGMTTSSQGNWLRTFAKPPQMLNITFIAQMYGYDNLNVFPDDYIVSNAVYFVL